MCMLGEIKVKYSVSLKLNRDFRRAYGKGKSTAVSTMALYIRENKLNINRVGITVSTKIGKAVQRNKIRRRFREIYRLNEEKIKIGYDIVIVARHKSRTADFWNLESEFKRAAEKLGILKGN